MDDWSQILAALRDGDLAAFDRVTRLITGYLSRLGAYEQRDSWDDLVQEVLVSVLRGPPASSEPAQVVRHIQTTTHRKLVDQIRREQGRRRTDASDPKAASGWRRNVSLDDHEGAVSLFPDHESAQAGLDEGLRKALAGLGERERRAVECRYVLGCSNEEGAERLEVSLATYKRVLSRALGELRARLVDPAEPP